MSGRKRVRDVVTDTTLRKEGLHVVNGASVHCCEQGETDCPCTCHEPPPLRLRPLDPPPEAA